MAFVKGSLTGEVEGDGLRWRRRRAIQILRNSLRSPFTHIEHIAHRALSLCFFCTLSLSHTLAFPYIKWRRSAWGWAHPRPLLSFNSITDMDTKFCCSILFGAGSSKTELDTQNAHAHARTHTHTATLFGAHTYTQVTSFSCSCLGFGPKNATAT